MSESAETMNVPVTKGGFSNDGSAVLSRDVQEQENCEIPLKITISVPAWIAAKLKLSVYQQLVSQVITPDTFVEVTVSSSLWSSGLSIIDYYDVKAIISFIEQHNAKRVAIQFPDHLITDAPIVLDIINNYFQSSSRTPSDSVDSVNNPTNPLLYILGDTSYGSCCIDEVASQHINADILIHVGFACMSPSSGIPVLHCFGNHSLLPTDTTLNASTCLQHDYGYSLTSSTSTSTPIPTSTSTSTSYYTTQAVDLALPSPLQALVITLSSPSIADYLPAAEEEDDEEEEQEWDDDEEEEETVVGVSDPTISTTTNTTIIAATTTTPATAATTDDVKTDSTTTTTATPIYPSLPHPKRSLLLAYDRSYNHHIPLLIASLRAVGVAVVTTEKLWRKSREITVVNAEMVQKHLNSRVVSDNDEETSDSTPFVHDIVLVITESDDVTGAFKKNDASNNNIFLTHVDGKIKARKLPLLYHEVNRNSGIENFESENANSQPSLSFTGYSWPIHPLPLQQLLPIYGKGNQEPSLPTSMFFKCSPNTSFALPTSTSTSTSTSASTSTSTSSPPLKLVSAMKVWEHYFCNRKWCILFLGAPTTPLPSIQHTTLSSSPSSLPSTTSSFSSSVVSSQLAYDLPLTQGSTSMSSHFALNFSLHNVFTLTVPAMQHAYTFSSHATSLGGGEGITSISKLLSEGSSEKIHETQKNFQNDEDMCVFASVVPFVRLTGTRDTSRLMSRRFYMVEKAKNANIYGIVVCTLVAKQYMRVIKKLQDLIKENGKKSYLLIVGKINEPKLLNFPDIEMFIMISCPVSVLLQSYSHVSSVDVITAVEAELALGENRVWDGKYSTDYSDIFPKTGRLGQGSLDVEDKKYVFEQLHGNNGQGSSNSNVSTSGEQEGEEEEDAVDVEKSTGIVDVLGLHVEEEEEEDGDGEDEDEEEPRFSIVDGRYHVSYKKTVNKQKKEALGGAEGEKEEKDTENANIVFGLVEVGANALVDPGYKPYQRTYTGLDANYQIEDINMHIQPGLYGTARGYVTMDQKDTEHGQKI